mmetsp:Transcript_4168/g.6389  ORF Transcript_4168/g.6389 Transcript_4168/m.6389 type:complete len:115 (-) Transcript_4168:1059-1403(-)
MEHSIHQPSTTKRHRKKRRIRLLRKRRKGDAYYNRMYGDKVMIHDDDDEGVVVQGSVEEVLLSSLGMETQRRIRRRYLLVLFVQPCQRMKRWWTLVKWKGLLRFGFLKASLSLR